MTTYASDSGYSVRSTGNSTLAPLSAGASFTGTAEENPFPMVFFDVRADADCTVYAEFSVDGSNWTRFPENGFRLTQSNSWTVVDVAVKAGRSYRLVIENGATPQTFLRAVTDYGVYAQLNAPLVQSISQNAGATVTRPTIAQDEISRGLRNGVSQFNQFGYRENLASAAGEQTLWGVTTSTDLVIMKTADTFNLNYDSATDGLGNTGALSVLISYIDANEKVAQYNHVLGNTGTDAVPISGFGINRIVVTGSGSNDANVNEITLTESASGNLQAAVPAGAGITQQAIFFAPNDQTSVVKLLTISTNKLTGSNPKVTFKGYVYSRTFDSRFEIFRTVIDTQSGTSEALTDPCNFPLSPRDVIYFVADTDQNNTVAACRFSLNLYRND